MKVSDKIKPYILLSPVLFIIISILGYGIINCVMESLGYFPPAGLSHITTKYYREVLGSNSFKSSLKFSLYSSMVSSVLSAIIGVLVSWAILVVDTKRKFIKSVCKFPIIVPHTVVVILMFNIISQSGVISRILYNLGIIRFQNSFPNLVFDKFGVGIILTYMWKEIPFIVTVIYGVMIKINEELFQAALNLGANRIKAFLYVILPITMPAVLSCFLIVFAFCFGSFEVPYLLGPTEPKALPVKAYIDYSSSDLQNRPYAMVVNMILIFVSIILIYLYQKIYKIFTSHKKL